MGAHDDAPRLAFTDAAALRAWFEASAEHEGGFWLVLPRKGVDERSVTYEEAVEEALCFGWIDGTANTHDGTHSRLWFARRRPSSTWARTNKDRVERLIAEGRMTPAGQACIDVAKANGSWKVLDDAEALIVADDLAAALDATPGARDAWEAWPPGTRKVCLSQLALAKRPETRAKRIATVLAALADGTKPFGL